MSVRVHGCVCVCACVRVCVCVCVCCMCVLCCVFFCCVVLFWFVGLLAWPPTRTRACDCSSSSLVLCYLSVLRLCVLFCFAVSLILIKLPLFTSASYLLVAVGGDLSLPYDEHTSKSSI